MQISSIGCYVTSSQRFYLFTQMLQHLRCLMLVAVETALNHIQIVVAASSIIECKGRSEVLVLSAFEQSLLEECVAALVQEAAKNVAAGSHDADPGLRIILSPKTIHCSSTCCEDIRRAATLRSLS